MVGFGGNLECVMERDQGRTRKMQERSRRFIDEGGLCFALLCLVALVRRTRVRLFILGPVEGKRILGWHCGRS